MSIWHQGSLCPTRVSNFYVRFSRFSNSAQVYEIIIIIITIIIITITIIIIITITIITIIIIIITIIIIIIITCRIVDFAVQADHRVKLKGSEKKDKYVDLSRKVKKNSGT